MIRIPQAAFDRIREHAENTFPEECCGVLLGTAEEDARCVVDLFRIDNAFEASEKFHRFLVTPERYRQAEEMARKRGLDLLGFYHSHPSAPARPSTYDLEHAYPWFSYIIVSVIEKRFRDVRSWTLEDDRSRFNEETVAVA